MKAGDARDINCREIVHEEGARYNILYNSGQMCTDRKWGGCPYQPLTATCNSGELIRVLQVMLLTSGKRNVSKRRPITISISTSLQSGKPNPHMCYASD